MRPRKVILYVDKEPSRTETALLMLDSDVRVMVIQHSVGTSSDNLAALAKQIQPGLLVSVVAERFHSLRVMPSVDAFLLGAMCTPANMREQLRIMSGRKRGPKRQVAA